MKNIFFKIHTVVLFGLLLSLSLFFGHGVNTYAQEPKVSVVEDIDYDSATSVFTYRYTLTNLNNKKVWWWGIWFAEDPHALLNDSTVDMNGFAPTDLNDCSPGWKSTAPNGRMGYYLFNAPNGEGYGFYSTYASDFYSANHPGTSSTDPLLGDSVGWKGVDANIITAFGIQQGGTGYYIIRSKTELPGNKIFFYNTVDYWNSWAEYDQETKTDRVVLGGLEFISMTCPAVAVAFSASPTGGCAPPLTVQFTNSSTGATSYSWNFGDGSAANTTTSPSHAYKTPGTYTVTLTATNACGNTVLPKANLITVVTGPPVAAFSASPTSGCAPLTVQFTNSSMGATSYSWNFGDGSAANTTTSPSHAYTTAAGPYTVTLTATNACGNTIETKTNLITVGQKIRLNKGWNLLSFQVNNCYYETMPTVFIPGGVVSKNVGSLVTWLKNDTLSPIRDATNPAKAGDWQRIISFDSKGSHILDKSIPAFANTLKYLSVGYGYWIKMNESAVLELQGGPAPANTVLSLRNGWNLIGYIPYYTCYGDLDQTSVYLPYSGGQYTPDDKISYCRVNSLTPLVLASIDGQYRRITSLNAGSQNVGAKIFDRQLPPFANTLHYFGPHYGYWIKIENQAGANLIFP